MLRVIVGQQSQPPAHHPEGVSDFRRPLPGRLRGDPGVTLPDLNLGRFPQFLPLRPKGLGQGIAQGRHRRADRIAPPGTCSGMTGSRHNDPYEIQDGKVVTPTNRHGGILGGITTGMPIVVRAAIKPTPSIAREQASVSLSQQKNDTLAVRGRHDPCIVPRAVPCVEAAVAVILYDLMAK